MRYGAQRYAKTGGLYLDEVWDCDLRMAFSRSMKSGAKMAVPSSVTKDKATEKFGSVCCSCVKATKISSFTCSPCDQSNRSCL